MRNPAPIAGKRQTSAEAAESMKSHSAQQRGEVFAFIRAAGSTGATRDQISASLNIGLPSVAPRVLELIGAGDVVETKARRKTRSGRNAAVVVAAEFDPERQTRPPRYVPRNLF